MGASIGHIATHALLFLAAVTTLVAGVVVCVGAPVPCSSPLGPSAPAGVYMDPRSAAELANASIPATADTDGPMRLAVLVAGGDAVLAAAMERRLDGIRVAIDAANRRDALSGRPVARPLIVHNITSANVDAAVRGLAAGCANVSAVLALLPIELLRAAVPSLEATNTTAFYGYESILDDEVRSPNVIFTRPSSLLYAHAMVHAAVVLRQLRRVAIVTSDDAIGIAVGAAITSLLLDFDLVPTAWLKVPDSTVAATDADVAALLGSAANNTDPQAVLMFVDSPAEAGIASLVGKLLRASNGTSRRFFFHERITDSVEDVVDALNGTLKGMRLVSVQSVPYAAQHNSTAAARFRAEYTSTQHDAAANASLTTPFTLLLEDGGYSLLTVGGWMDASIAVEAVRTMGRNTSRALVSGAVLADRVLSVGEWWFGLYTNDCDRFQASDYAADGGTDDNAATATATARCSCNVGGRQLALVNMDATTGALAPTESPFRDSFNSGVQQCRLRTEKVTAPVLTYFPIIADSLLETGDAYGAFAGAGIDTTAATLRRIVKADAVATGGAELATILRDRFVATLLGGHVHLPVAEGNAALPVCDAADVLPRLRASQGSQANVIHLQPALEHELLALAAFAFAHPLPLAGQAAAPATAASTTTDRTVDRISAQAVLLVAADSDGGVTGRSFASGASYVNYSTARIIPLGPDGLEAIRVATERALHTHLVRLAASVLLPFRPSALGTASALAEWLRATVVAPPNAYIVVVGLTSSPLDQELAALATFLARNPQAVVMLPFETVQEHYDPLLAALATLDHRDRVVFATALPRWTLNVSADSPIGLHSSLYASYRHALRANTTGRLVEHPLALRGVIGRAFLESVYSQAVDTIGFPMSAADFLGAVYTSTILTVDKEFKFGPFADGTRCAGGSSVVSGGSVSCATQNQNTLFAMRMERLSIASGTRNASSAAPSDAFLLAAFNPAALLPLPTPPAPPAFMATARGIATVAVLSVLAAVGLALLVPLHSCCMQRLRDRRAPQDSARPFTIVFTDVQSSTALWAELPEQMGPALDAHNALIRELIARHRGYEVKTVGDAFMIAFCSAKDAVHMAAALQHTFMAHDWGTAAFDDAIKELELEALQARLEESGDEHTHHRPGHHPHKARALPPSAAMPQALYDRTWRGLRVRVGVHTGIGTIKRDDTSGRFDYFGSVVNTAARVEAAGHGGQVLLTADALRAWEAEDPRLALPTPSAALAGAHSGSATTDPGPDHRTASSQAPGGSAQTTETATTATGQQAADGGPSSWIVSRGPCALRGLPAPVPLFELTVVPGRVFGALRDVDCDMDDSASSSQQTASTNGTAASLASDAAIHVMSPLLAALSVAFLQSLFLPLPAKQRTERLRELCRRWRVPLCSPDVASHFILGMDARPRSPEPGGGSQGRRESQATDGQSDAGTVTTIGATDSGTLGPRRPVASEADRFVVSLAPRIGKVMAKRLPRRIGAAIASGPEAKAYAPRASANDSSTAVTFLDALDIGDSTSGVGPRRHEGGRSHRQGAGGCELDPWRRRSSGAITGTSCRTEHLLDNLLDSSRNDSSECRDTNHGGTIAIQSVSTPRSSYGSPHSDPCF